MSTSLRLNSCTQNRDFILETSCVWDSENCLAVLDKVVCNIHKSCEANPGQLLRVNVNTHESK